ncbi:MAG: type IV secretory system conjugative DNA transfer family protein [Sphingobacteriales bacterium]
MQEEFMRPINISTTGDYDPYTPLFGILERLEGEQHVAIQIMFSGTQNTWAESIMTAVCDNTGKASFFLDEPVMPALAKEKIAKPLFGVAIRAVCCDENLRGALSLLTDSATAVIHLSTSPFNNLMYLGEREVDPPYTVGDRLADVLLRQTRRVGMLLNSRELAMLVHFPEARLQRKLTQSNRTTKAASNNLINQRYCIGINEHLGTEHLVGLETNDRLRHIHILGATGTGKSTLLHSLMCQDIEHGAGFMCLDPHGDLIAALLSCVPERRIKDVVLIDPSDSAFPVGFNILSANTELEKELLASDLVAFFKRFSTSWGDQMHSVLANAILALLYNKKTYHLGDLRKFLIESAFRNSILSSVTDPDIVYYWQHEFPIVKGGSIGPILTRLDAFLRPKIIRNMVCQTKGLDFAELMDSKKIVLVKLSQGLVGAENSYLLGAFIVSKLQQTAMARQTQQHRDRVPFYCYVDEFQHFVTPSMATILSGARKYALGLILAHQDMAQVSKYDSDIANAVLSNAGTRICFRLGDTDAKRMQEGFSSFIADDLQNLEIGQAITRVNTNESDFNLAVIPFENDDEDYTEAVVEYSRSAYSIPIQETNPGPDIVEERPTQPPTPEEPITRPAVEAQEAPIHKEEIREHRYLQIFVKKMAEEFGYKASLEVCTPGETGLVDVLLEKEGTTTAVEISVTTLPEWELHNIQKCLEAGYNKVIVCSKDPMKRKEIQTLVEHAIPKALQTKIEIINPDNIRALLQPAKSAAPTETIMKGYRVKVQYDDNADRKNILQSIINAAKK